MTVTIVPAHALSLLRFLDFFSSSVCLFVCFVFVSERGFYFSRRSHNSEISLLQLYSTAGLKTSTHTHTHTHIHTHTHTHTHTNTHTHTHTHTLTDTHTHALKKQHHTHRYTVTRIHYTNKRRRTASRKSKSIGYLVKRCVS